MLRYLRRVPRPLLACKLLFIVGCAYMVLSGLYPPAHAQDAPSVSSGSAAVYGLEIRAAVQQDRIDHLANDIAEIKATQLRMSDELKANTNGLSTQNGEQIGIGALLMLLQIGSIFFAARKGKDRAAI